jgi:hypothetical protein
MDLLRTIIHFPAEFRPSHNVNYTLAGFLHSLGEAAYYKSLSSSYRDGLSIENT